MLGWRVGRAQATFMQSTATPAVRPSRAPLPLRIKIMSDTPETGPNPAVKKDIEPVRTASL